ncbi:outer membrane lipoprotein chaperone LolA [Lysobacter sp. A3-1-A15]|uniref:outer membrane lipoprotein chaperone LolA n=1 Tax=Novilysobacter viscosus TaxID=3098602 RepID=UPI002EDB4966
MTRISRYSAIATAVLASALFAAPALAGARDDLDSFTRGLKGLDGKFNQKVYDAGGRLKETSSGDVALSAPRLFRWEYAKPYPQLIVADGKTVWIYDEDLEQVTRRPQGAEEQNSPLTALIDPSRLDRQFVVKEEGEKGGLSWLSLVPRDEGGASFRSARLAFGNGGLERMIVVDAVGQRTEIKFGKWERNPAFPASTFKYTPPAGVDVIGG